MTKDDLKFLAGIIEKSHWLFYGDLDPLLQPFARKVLEVPFSVWSFDKVATSPDFGVAFWMFVSELISLDLMDYGTSPRAAFLTAEGKRFKQLIFEHEDAIEQAVLFTETDEWKYRENDGG